MRIWLTLAALVIFLSASAHAQTNEPDPPKPVPATQPPPPQKSNAAIRAVLQVFEKSGASRATPTPQPSSRSRSSRKSSSRTRPPHPGSLRHDAERADRNGLFAYYHEHVEQPIWVTPAGILNARAEAVLKELANADDWGLSATDYALPRDIHELTTSSASGAQADPGTLAKIEIAVSMAALRYARHARGGRIPEPATQLSSYLDRTPDLLAPSVVMNALRQESNLALARYLQTLHPRHAQFERLRKALLALRNGATREQKPEDVKLPASGPMLRMGRSHAEVALLRKRLSVSVATPSTPTPATKPEQPGQSDPTPANPEEVFDQALKDAVKAFQRENGLSPDGLVGRGTRRALNSAGSGAITEDAIRANMEAWRWMPDELGPTYVTVNIPEFKVRVIKNGSVIHEERAIVGKTNNQTPVFSDQMETIVIHPSWGVPNSIKVKEIWPSLARGGNVLQRQHLRLKRNGRIVNPNTINWAYADIRNYDVYQPPGSHNVLGIVKFLFPNRHQVYMHDTPTKKLFGEQIRTFSHGCMRLRNPVRLAEIVLEQDRNWTPDDVSELISSGPKQNRIVLNTKVPVHTTYFTIVVDEDGTVQRLKDIYGHEQRIKLALNDQFDRIDRGRDHLAPVRYSRRNIEPQSFNELFQSIFGGF